MFVYLRILMTCSLCKNTNFAIDNRKEMAKKDIEKLIKYSKEYEGTEPVGGMKYDTGNKAMVYSRGNILLGKGSFMESLHVGAVRRYLVNLLF